MIRMSSLDGEVCILLDPYKHCCKNPCVKKQFKDYPTLTERGILWMNQYVIGKMIQKPGNNRLDPLWRIRTIDQLFHNSILYPN